MLLWAGVGHDIADRSRRHDTAPIGSVEPKLWRDDVIQDLLAALL